MRIHFTLIGIHLSMVGGLWFLINDTAESTIGFLLLGGGVVVTLGTLGSYLVRLARRTN